MEFLLFEKLDKDAVIPVRSTPGSAGYDLSSKKNSTTTVVPARGKAIVKTGLRVNIPDGYYGRIAARSSVAWKNCINVGGGVIDRDYEGDVGVILFNLSEDEKFVIEPGKRVAQLILEKIITPPVYELVRNTKTGRVTYLQVTAPPDPRGTGGFGSTGTEMIK